MRDMKPAYAIWLMGPTSSGKTTIADRCFSKWLDQGIPILHFDGDEIRDLFGENLGFAPEDRLKVVKTLVYFVNKSIKAGIHVIVSALTANSDARRFIAENIPGLIVGYIECDIATCIERDPKGLYRKAINGEINTLVGYNNAYLPPERCDFRINTECTAVDDCVLAIEEYLRNTEKKLR